MTKTFILSREFRVNSLVFESRLAFIVTPGSRTVRVFSETAADGVAETMDIRDARKTWAWYLAQKPGRVAGGFADAWKWNKTSPLTPTGEGA